MRAASFVLAAVLILSIAPAAVAEGVQTLTGEFVWSHRNNSGDLEAIFTETEEGRWEVEFHFTFRGKPHVFSGTAEGSLHDGELKGTVNSENKARTFTFSGTVKDGQFEGTHAEMEDGTAHRTGTLSLGG